MLKKKKTLLKKIEKQTGGNFAVMVCCAAKDTTKDTQNKIHYSQKLKQNWMGLFLPS